MAAAPKEEETSLESEHSPSFHPGTPAGPLANSSIPLGNLRQRKTSSPCEQNLSSLTTHNNVAPFSSRGFTGGSNSQESACNVGDLSSIPRSGRSPGEGILF